MPKRISHMVRREFDGGEAGPRSRFITITYWCGKVDDVIRDNTPHTKDEERRFKKHLEAMAKNPPPVCSKCLAKKGSQVLTKA